MKNFGMPDTLIVVNGPQDGTEFPITHHVSTIGSDPGCGVCLQLDSAIEATHGQMTPGGGGYRIRSETGTPMHVNGKLAGRLKSRMLKPGELLRVGHTDLLLVCADDGLAHRSLGINLENDFVWAIRHLGSESVNFATQILHLFLSAPVKFARRYKYLVCLLALLLAIRFIPFLRYYAYAALDVVAGLLPGV